MSNMSFSACNKVIVFFSSCASVDFHYDLLTEARVAPGVRRGQAEETAAGKWRVWRGRGAGGCREAAAPAGAGATAEPAAAEPDEEGQAEKAGCCWSQ